MLIKDFALRADGVGPVMNLYCVGDIHYGSPCFQEQAWDRLADIARKDKLAHFIQLGDITESDRPSTRQRRADMFSDRREALSEEDIQYLCWLDAKLMPKLLKVIKPERCFGVLDGDHYRLLENGLSTAQYICAKNKIPYLGTGQAMLRFNFKYGEGNSMHTVKMHVHHGKGSGVTEAADIGELQKLCNQWDGVDLFVRGHSHKPKFIPFTRYYDSRSAAPEVRVREGFLVNAGSFRKSLVMDKTDYAEAAVYAPTSSRCPIVHFTATKQKDKNSAFIVELSASLTIPL